MNNAEPTAIVDVDVTLEGPLPGAGDYARRKIGGLARTTRQPITHVRVRLTNHCDRALARPVVAQANLEIGGRAIRAQVEAATSREAIDALDDKLRRILQRNNRRWPFLHRLAEVHDGRPAAPALRQWPSDYHTDEGNRVIRRKSFGVPPLHVSDAVDKLDSLDYTFYLFTEKSTGRDCVLYRSGPDSYRLACNAVESTNRPPRTPTSVTISPTAPPKLTVPQAIRWLSGLGVPFLFFVDAADGRGSVLYLRYDGRYGLIVPGEPGGGRPIRQTGERSW